MSEADFARLPTAQKGGFIKRSDFGRFIAENLLRDPKSKVLELNAAKLLVGDFGVLMQTIGRTLGQYLQAPTMTRLRLDERQKEKLTKLLGEDNLVGSSGEFGLLFAFLTNKPGVSEIDGEPALSLEDVRGMFLDMTLPTGWQSWKKRRVDRTVHTTAAERS